MSNQSPAAVQFQQPEAQSTPPVDSDPVDEFEIPDPEGADQLGDAGKKALGAMKADLKRAREELAELRAKQGDKRGLDAVNTKAKLELDQSREEIEALKAKIEGREKQYAEQKRQREVEAEALAKANERILKAEVRAVAAARLADPADALRFLDLSTFEVGDAGEVNRSAVEAAIDDLIEKKPYLAAQGGKRFQGSADGGARNGKTKPSQLTREDVQRLAKAGKHQEIEKARVEGRLEELLTGSK